MITFQKLFGLVPNPNTKFSPKVKLPLTVGERDQAILKAVKNIPLSCLVVFGRQAHGICIIGLVAKSKLLYASPAPSDAIVCSLRSECRGEYNLRPWRSLDSLDGFRKNKRDRVYGPF